VNAALGMRAVVVNGSEIGPANCVVNSATAV